MNHTQCLEPRLGEPTKFQRFVKVFIRGTKKIITLLFSHVGLVGLVIAYTLLGSVLFVELESPNEIELRRKMLQSKEEYVEKVIQHFKKNGDEIVLLHGKWRNDVDDILKSFQGEVYHASKTLGWDGYIGDEELQWSFVGALLYAVTIITTIGYGNVSPTTNWGRVTTIIYAGFGIPLTLLCLRNIGNCFAGFLNILYRSVCRIVQFQFSTSRKSRSSKQNKTCFGNICKRRKYRRRQLQSSKTMIGGPMETKNAEDEKDICSHGNEITFIDDDTNVKLQVSHVIDESTNSIGDSLDEAEPDELIALAKPFSENCSSDNVSEEIVSHKSHCVEKIPFKYVFCIVTGYIMCGAMLFASWEENWDFLIGFYFCFITLSTIGLGDFVPGTGVESWSNQEKTILCSFYLMGGLAIMSMAFQLVQQDVNRKFRQLALRLGLLTEKGKL